MAQELAIDLLNQIQQNALSQQGTTQDIAKEAIQRRAAGDAEVNGIQQLGELKQESASLLGDLNLKAQETIRAMSTELGTNRDEGSYRLGQYAQELSAAHEDRVAKTQFLNEMRQVSFTDNPLEWFYNKLTEKSQVQAVQEAQVNETQAALSYNNLVTNTTAAARMAKETAISIAQETIANSVAQLGQDSLIQAAKVKAENANSNVTLMQAVQQGKNQEVESARIQYGVVLQEAQEGRAEESMRLQEENAARQREAFKLEQDARAAQVKALDEKNQSDEAALSYVVKGMVAMGKPAPSGVSLKTLRTLYATPEGKVAYGIYFQQGLDAELLAGRASTYGAPLNDPAQAALNLAKFGGQGVKGSAVPLLMNELRGINSGEILNPADRAAVQSGDPKKIKEVLQNQIAKTVQVLASNPDADTSAVNPYRVTLGMVADTPVTATKFGKIVLAPALVAGRADLPVERIVALTQAAVTSGHLTPQEGAQGLAEFTQTGMAKVNAGVMGVLPTISKYPAQVSSNSALGLSLVQKLDASSYADNVKYLVQGAAKAKAMNEINTGRDGLFKPQAQEGALP